MMDELDKVETTMETVRLTMDIPVVGKVIVGVVGFAATIYIVNTIASTGIAVKMYMDTRPKKSKKNKKDVD